MNITNRTTHSVQQGTGPWLRLREGFDTASEAPAALGVSRYVTRAELLRRKHTGIAEEHSAATLGKFAAGHEAEALARPLAEEEVAEELFPVTMTAEVDGLKVSRVRWRKLRPGAGAMTSTLKLTEGLLPMCLCPRRPGQGPTRRG
jgi:predicted phage-related endonuclease